MTDMPLALYPQGLYDVRPCFQSWAPACAAQVHTQLCSTYVQCTKQSSECDMHTCMANLAGSCRPGSRTAAAVGDPLLPRVPGMW